MHYEIWKWIDTGEVEFRLHATSRRARRMRRLTQSQLELAGVGR